jgi:hypothetical protein
VSEPTSASTARTLSDREKLDLLHREYREAIAERDQAREERDQWRRLCKEAERRARGYECDDYELRGVR